jgi:hypothetical protein
MTTSSVKLGKRKIFETPDPKDSYVWAAIKGLGLSIQKELAKVVHSAAFGRGGHWTGQAPIQRMQIGRCCWRWKSCVWANMVEVSCSSSGSGSAKQGGSIWIEIKANHLQNYYNTLQTCVRLMILYEPV